MTVVCTNEPLEPLEPLEAEGLSLLKEVEEARGGLVDDLVIQAVSRPSVICGLPTVAAHLRKVTEPFFLT